MVALLPVTLLPSPGVTLGYLAVFGAGTVVGMGAYAAVAALAVGRAAESLWVARALALGTSGLSVAVGLWWLVRIAG